MRWAIGIIVLSFIGFIVGVTWYLAPNDFRDCGETPSATAGCEAADAIVTVSGGDTSARTAKAIDLYQKGWAAQLVFAGAAQDSSGPSNAAVMRAQALRAGVPETAIVTEEESRSTAENAQQTRELFTQRSIDTIILVTSGYHQRRAYLEFDKYVGAKVKILNQPVASDKQWSQAWWSTPQGWWLAVSETVKIGAFYLGSSR